MKSTYRKMPVGAHTGTSEWLFQRVTAVFMTLYTLFMAGFVVWCSPRNYADWKTMFSGNFIRVLTLLFIFALLYHAWVGMRDIWMDYIKPTGLRLALQMGTVGLLLFYAVWSVSILWSV